MNKNLKNKIRTAAINIQSKIEELDFEKLQVSDYYKKNWNIRQKNIRQELQKYVFILNHILNNTNKNLNNFVFADYGGGTDYLHF